MGASLLPLCSRLVSTVSSTRSSSAPCFLHCLSSHCMPTCSKHCPWTPSALRINPESLLWSRLCLFSQTPPTYLHYYSVGFLSFLNDSKVFKFTISNLNTCPLPFPLALALCPLPLALCSLPLAPCPCPLPFAPAPYPLPLAPCPLPLAPCPLPFTLCPLTLVWQAYLMQNLCLMSILCKPQRLLTAPRCPCLVDFLPS